MSTISILTIIFCYCNIGNSVNITIVPRELKEFRVGDIRNITLTVWSESLRDAQVDISPLVHCADLSVCNVTAVTQIKVTTENETSITYNVTVQTIFLGITYLDVEFDGERIGPQYVIRVLRAAVYVTLSRIFNCVAAVFVTTVTFMMGTQLEWNKIRNVLKTPVGPAIGFVCQFVLMPLTGYILAEVGLHRDQYVLKLALFAAAICPGGGKSSFWTIIYGGNLDLSVAMTFTQTISALVMMPFWLSTLGKNFTTSRVTVPFSAIVEGLILLLIPSGLGMFFIHKKPHLIRKMERYIKICSWCATVFFTIFVVYSNWYVFLLLTWRTVIVGCLLPWFGYVIAYLAALVLRQNPIDRMTIAIETGVQNVGIATILMMWSLPEPEVDISLTILFAIVLSTDKPLIIIWLVMQAVRCIRRRSNKDDPSNESETKYTVNGDNVEVTITKSKDQMEENIAPTYGTDSNWNFNKL